MAGSFWILAQGLWERNRITDADREWLLSIDRSFGGWQAADDLAGWV